MCLLMFASCDKEEVNSTLGPPLIVHTNPTPDSIIQSCDTLIFWSSYNYPSPGDPVLYYNYNMNSDGNNDLRFYAGNYYQFYSNITPQLNYQRYIGVMSPDSSIEFASQSGPPLLVLYDSLDFISPGSNWESSSYAVYQHTSFPFGQTISDVNYIAIRMKAGTGSYRYGWMRLKRFGAVEGYQYYLTDWGLNWSLNQYIHAGEY